MDIPIHNQILWRACQVAAQRLAGKPSIGDPRAFYPLLVRGSWMNDTNQATIFLDRVAPDALSNTALSFFRHLWLDEQQNVLDGLERQAASDVVTRARQAVEGAQHTDDFSNYIPHDHLDVVDENPAVEYDTADETEHRNTALTVRDSMTFHVPERLIMSSFNRSADERLTPFKLTELGRSLHTVADFFSHTNYVELLLWTAAHRSELSPELVEAFERAPTPFGPHAADTHPRFRLPIGASDYPLKDAFMWYGASPHETPLVSALFNMDDTAHSLLEMYATHLESADGEVSSDELELALSVFQVPGRPIARALFKAYRAASDFLADIGRKAREFVVDAVADLVAGADDKVRKDLDPVVALMKHYDSKTAANWAKAGKFRYLVNVIDTQLAKKLENQDFLTPQLPNHSLLAKDHPHGHRSAVLRHHVACALAVDATASVLEWHFAKEKPTRDSYDDLARGCFTHPVHQLGDNQIVSGAQVDMFARRLALTDWYDLDYREGLLQWRA